MKKKADDIVLKCGLLCVFFFFITTSIFSQADTSFWFVAPDLQEQHGDRPIFLRISSLSNPAVVTISQPANPSFPIQTINLGANSSQSVDLTTWIDLVENQPVNTVLNKGLLVRSTSKISCYYDITNYANGDMYVLKGKNALGKKFTVPFQQAFSSSYGGTPTVTATFEIVATEDNTTITVLPAKNLTGHPAGTAFTIVLNRGQTYSCAAESNDPLNRPGGTVVISDKPIAISTKDDSINYPGYTCADTAGDQLIPDALAGTEFVIIKGYLYQADNYYVFAIADATTVKENGLVVATINTGQYYKGILNADACYVETSKPVQVFHISGFGCELGGAVIPSVKCTGSNSVSLTRATDQGFYVNLIAPPGIIADFTLNGQNNIITPAQFQTVPGSNTAWMFARILLDVSQVPVGGIAIIKNNSGKFHAGLIHGDASTTCRYGFFSDFANYSLEFINNLSPYYIGSDVAITATSTDAVNFVWEGPNSFISNGPNLVINNFQPSQQGFYKVTASGNMCGSVTDSTYVSLFETNIVQNDTAICAGSSLLLSVNLPTQPGSVILPPGSQFEYTFNTPPGGWTTSTGGWTLGNAPFGNEANGAPPEFNYNTYWPAASSSASHLYVRRNINLYGYDLSTIHWWLGVDNGFTLYVNGNRVDSEYAEGYTYRWEYSGIMTPAFLNPGNNIIAIALEDNGGLTAFDMMMEGQPVSPGLSILWSTGETTASINVTPAQTTTYYVTITYGATVTMDSIRITVNQPSIQSINASICQGENYLGYTSSGTYIDTLIAANGCDSIRTINLTVEPRSVFSINQSICQGQNYSGHTSSGTYIDTFIADNGCDSIRTLQLTVLPENNPYLGIDTILCTGDSIILYPGQFTGYTWQDGSAQSHLKVKQPGLYSVIVTDNCGSARDEIMIMEANCDIYFPSAFTPNNDGKNDWFKILGGNNLKEFHLAVFNRWGQKIFETFDYAKGWNGTINGQLQSSATFVWYCEFKKPGNADKTKMKGTVTLIR